MPEQVPEKVAKVLIFSDIGRSPRMQYHALSLATSGLKVNIIGYLETQPLTEILENPNISITKLHPLVFDRAPQIIQYALKAIWQAISLLLTLFMTGKCDYLLCQNPPAIPTFPICTFYCLVSRSTFIIDWHNYAFTIMSMALPQGHWLLRLSRLIEMSFGRASKHNLCVTYAMKQDLLQNYNIEATVLYDRPPKIFHSITIQEKHSWFKKLSEQYSEFACANEEMGRERTAFTEIVDGEVRMRQDRPGLLFSSTSWTPDEDFGILLEALQVYETTYKLTNKLPKLVCVITGKGPMKREYIQQIASRKWQNVSVITPWLEANDYPRMVASADLGVCLHTSSSGLDLPMKVVDMYGAGLPVCAYDFQCLDELVENDVNGYTFNSSDELSKRIVAWFEGFPNNETQNQIVEKMKAKISKFQESRWEENWNLRAKKLFLS